MKAAEAFGRVDDNGTVYVREGDSEREVGQFPDVSKEEALSLYARRYLDLKAKLDLLASRLHSDTVKSHEIDETLKSLEQETDKPAAVGDMAALKQQFEQLKEAGVAEIHLWAEINEPEFCEDCGAPLFPNARGDVVHAEMPEDVEPDITHFH